ncbi:hypothetical protein GE09DRAFT_1258681 [Coniochaeta sp. 2T2.1]|nr:hypothetical protein GE09DRAFT_1258681 [Coniochaeta sp. 2T2.1]
MSPQNSITKLSKPPNVFPPPSIVQPPNPLVTPSAIITMASNEQPAPGYRPKITTGKKRTFKDTLPQVGFKYHRHYATKEKADRVLAAMREATGIDVMPTNADELLAVIFQRAAENSHLLHILDHYHLWNAVYKLVPWFRAAPDLSNNKLRLLAVFLMQARIRATSNPAIRAMSQQPGQTAQAIDRYFGILESRNLRRYIPDHNSTDRSEPTGAASKAGGATSYAATPSSSAATSSSGTTTTAVASEPGNHPPSTGATIFSATNTPSILANQSGTTTNPPSSTTTTTNPFRPADPAAAAKFSRAFLWKPTVEKRKVVEDEAENDVDTLAAGFGSLSGLGARRPLRDVKRRLAVKDGTEDERLAVATKTATEEVLGMTDLFGGLGVKEEMEKEEGEGEEKEDEFVVEEEEEEKEKETETETETEVEVEEAAPAAAAAPAEAAPADDVEMADDGGEEAAQQQP